MMNHLFIIVQNSFRQNATAILCVLFVLVGKSTYGQNPKYIIPDSSEFRFELDIKYVGASTRIDPNYQYVLEYLVEVLEAYPNLQVHVRGHVCCGPAKKLSTRRAKKAAKIIVAMGISENRVTYDGYSDEIPIVSPEKTPEDAMKNRRVDFIIKR
jgi:outer membrane protein OmpA-like peptidoglycan-associated protein